MTPDDIAMRDRLMAEISRLRAALEKIADEENWGDDGGWDGDSYPDEIARAALTAA